MFNIPILFCFFNRPEIVKESFLKIQRIKPSKLYLSCDGPREGNTDDEQQIAECRRIISEMINWPCDVHKRFLNNNIGCSQGVSTAVSWMFSTEEFGIILEDDCIPDNSFFFFCEELLQRYKNDNRIGMIAGHNQLETYNSNYSYIFSKYKACWGWATWKRAWINFDISMKWRNREFENNIIKNMGYCCKDVKYWKYRLKMIDINEVSAWDWQWYFSQASQNQLCIFPRVNLISNVGFGDSATHTTFNKSISYIDEMKFPLIHPDYVLPDYDFDKAFYKKNNTIFYVIMRFIPVNIKHIVKGILRKIK